MKITTTTFGSHEVDVPKVKGRARGINAIIERVIKHLKDKTQTHRITSQAREQLHQEIREQLLSV